MEPRILIIDDDRTVCQSLKLLFSKAGFSVQTIYNPLNVLEFVTSFFPDIVLLDLNFSVDTSGREGLHILEKIRNVFPELPVILITAWGTLDLAVDGMKRGARDFITKPWDNQQLLESVQTQLNLRSTGTDTITNPAALETIIGQSTPMMEVKSLIMKVAQTDATVLITGGSGTGKELVAEAIHDNSRRKNQNFVKVNLGGIPDELFESEMFGHVKGAFTGAIQHRNGRFQEAEGGTIFLDEVGELSGRAQVKLLRVLQEKTFEPLGSSKTVRSDIRIISATHRELESMVATGEFREDLFYRVNLLHIHLPALAERREDIPLLVQYFVQRLNDSSDGKHMEVNDKALQWLSHQDFPGNIRQLRNIVERTWLLSSKKVLDQKNFAMNLTSSASSDSKTASKAGIMTLEEMEIEMIQRAMAFHDGNISRVARSLGITRSSLYRRLSKYNVDHGSIE
ncbi:MAG TPA: sigma-54 dependent transcriptional regulator [Membranihabitans sp.]|nr:sigma-54 dependent transcriptional regulator [Membranihabitans sp.]